tara:strand:+ start:3478 stop:3915 length:438 start_codon:yes stop_codon:yes gene_type:complete
VIEYRLRKGDLIITPEGPALLVRETKKYWYYLYKQHMARVSKAKLWRAIDSSDKITVNFGSSMKHRRKKKKDRYLDLHGVKHEKADDKVRSYLNFVELPTRIITGNSEHMKDIVHLVAKEYGWSCRQSIDNPGTLIIEELTIPKQ